MNTEIKNKSDLSLKSDLLSNVINYLLFFLVFILAILPLSEIILRKVFTTGIPAQSEYVQHLIILICFIGAICAYFSKHHLSLGIFYENIKIKFIKEARETLNHFFKLFVLSTLFITSLSFILNAFAPAFKVGFIPIKVFTIIIPASFFIMFVYETFKTKGIWQIIFSVVAVSFTLLICFDSIFNILFSIFKDYALLDTADGIREATAGLFTFFGNISVVLIIFLIISLFAGNYIFVVLGGISILLFLKEGSVLDVIPNEAYVMLTGSAIPAIPLFTIAGLIMAESKAGERILRFFNLFFGNVRGGLIIITVFMCAFFTTFTGASGVTILALGGILSYILIHRGYSEKFSFGLITASGSVGLLFPPSIAIIMYGVIAKISIKDMFIAGIIPGLIMMISIMVFGFFKSERVVLKKEKVNRKEIMASLKESSLELLLPLIIVISFFSGLTTIVESGALALLYVLIVECLVFRDIDFKKMKGIIFRAFYMLGGILIILGIAKGLSYYIIDAQVPDKLSLFLSEAIHSKYVFLLLLNIILLITGCLMDIFSAIVVVVPLMIPLGAIYGIDPVHLGIIFLCNLELGYMTPPVGLNLFLSSYAFKRPLAKIYNYVFPFLIIRLITVFLITYVPVILKDIGF